MHLQSGTEICIVQRWMHRRMRAVVALRSVQTKMMKRVDHREEMDALGLEQAMATKPVGQNHFLAPVGRLLVIRGRVAINKKRPIGMVAASWPLFL